MDTVKRFFVGLVSFFLLLDVVALSSLMVENDAVSVSSDDLSAVAGVDLSVEPAEEAYVPTVSTQDAEIYDRYQHMALGSMGPHVAFTQTVLSRYPEIYPEREVTGNFGPSTLKAIQRLQVLYGIAGPGDDGYGEVGPLTRIKLEELSRF